VRTFSFMIQDDRYTVPTVALVDARDGGHARDLAARRVAESPHHLAVEVLEGEAFLFTVRREKRVRFVASQT
jgi:hypothetical protein